MKLFSVYLRKTVLDGIQEWKPAEGEGHIRFMVNGLYGLCRTDGTLLAKPEYSELYGLTDDQHVLYVGVKELPGGKVSADYINELGLVVRRTRMAKDALDTILCLDW